MTQINYREFMESCGLDEGQVNVSCAMFDALQGEAIDGNGMGQVLMCMVAFVVHAIRNGIESQSNLTPYAEKNMQHRSCTPHRCCP